jgi:hypothetical protein
LSESGTNATHHNDVVVSKRKKLRLELIGELQSPASDAASCEIDHYLSSRIPAEYEDEPLEFWKHQEKSFPILSKVAEVYLGMSAASVPVECMFSTTGLISNGKRSSVGPQKLNRVLFIHDNFKLISSLNKNGIVQ